MLVLSRRVNETIKINDITIKLVRIAGKSVRIGIEAPNDIAITRGEIEHGRNPAPICKRA